MSTKINVGISSGILILFVIVIIIGYIYVEETRETQNHMNQTLTNITGEISLIIKQLQAKQIADNIRFNTTLYGLNKTYHIIVDNQKLIINLTNLQIEIANKSLSNQENIKAFFSNITDRLIYLTNLAQNNSANNLNLTKFNRASLVDTNNLIRDLIAKHNITITPFNSSRIG